MRKRMTAAAEDMRVRCPKCMALLEEVVLQELPERDWEQPTFHAMDGKACAPIKNVRAIGRCWEHGLQTTKI